MFRKLYNKNINFRCTRLDIIEITETHLRRSENIELDGYTWFGNNQTHIYMKALKESGGVWVLIRNFVNLEEFLNTIMSDFLYVYQTDSALVLVCGDFNIRVGDDNGFIVSVDDLPPLHVIGHNKSTNFQTFIDFLISTCMCILNGRISVTNN